MSTKILVIDDEPAVLRLLKTLLTRAHYEVTTAESGADGLRLAECQAFDGVVTDAIMPEMDGYEFVQRLRARGHSRLPVLMLTRKRHRQDVKRAVEAGVTDYAFKPIDDRLLLQKVESCLKRETAARPPVLEHPIGMGCRILSLEETGLRLRLPLPLEDRASLQLKSRIFEEMGITPPLVTLQSCEKTQADRPDLAAFPWEARLGFSNVPEADLQRIRSWIQRKARGAP